MCTRTYMWASYSCPFVPHFPLYSNIFFNSHVCVMRVSIIVIINNISHRRRCCCCCCCLLCPSFCCCCCYEVMKIYFMCQFRSFFNSSFVSVMFIEIYHIFVVVASTAWILSRFLMKNLKWNLWVFNKIVDCMA